MWVVLLAELPAVDGHVEAEEEWRRENAAEVGAEGDAEEHPDGVIGVDGADY